jgi:hypothetical protein
VAAVGKISCCDERSIGSLRGRSGRCGVAARHGDRGADPIGAGVARSMIIENNYGYTGPTSVMAGKLSAPGFARVDLNRAGRGCHRVWTNRTQRAPSAVSKLSLPMGYNNNNYAGIALAPSATAYLGVIGGIIAMRVTR